MTMGISVAGSILGVVFTNDDTDSYDLWKNIFFR